MSQIVPDLPSHEEVVTTTHEVIARYRETAGGLIPVLQRLQQHFGYLPEAALRTVSQEMSIPYSEVAGVVTFYSYFTTVPRGLHTVRVCLGTACYVRGGKEVLEAITRELGIGVGETTEDRVFTLEIGRCFGACGLAPVVMIDDTVHQRVGAACVKQIIDQYRVDVEVDEEVTV
ncbi:MAG: NAD(P)H-dependent oxidoreductase subunit E [Spirochaeta sp.]|jgi:NADH:ubiquinone oxidoreductase subunit E|nr:NAD(P)H-dependent oxidoreductase subunit E [Spirochaeta sp.]